MKIIDILRPTAPKTILFLLLMAGLNYWAISATPILSGQTHAGTPLAFWPVGINYWGKFMTAETQASMGISWANLAIDAVFWYAVSCVAVAIAKTQMKANPHGKGKASRRRA